MKYYCNCYYILIAIGVYKIRWYRWYKTYCETLESEPIMGYEKDAKEEATMLSSGVFTLKEVKELHNWKRVD